jgi:hypothetical protein
LKPTFDKIAVWLTNDQTPETIKSVKEDLIRLLSVKEKDIEFLDFQEQ